MGDMIHDLMEQEPQECGSYFSVSWQGSAEQLAMQQAEERTQYMNKIREKVDLNAFYSVELPF